VAEDAVLYELVSSNQNREINREFCGLWPFCTAMLASNPWRIQPVTAKFPYAAEQGIFAGINRENLARTGNFSPSKQGIGL
jgi:hypothetical protein